MLSAEAQLPDWKEYKGYSVYTKQIEQSANDKREYRLLKLNNQLKVLLIHDPETDRASASLHVNIGDSSNPDDLQGLAHFCEHLLFMGSEKYPKVNEYASYLAKHSGYYNANTATDYTNYHFEVGYEWLEGVLDRFSRFFIDPLFDKSCTDSELNAVDSEYKEYKQNDSWRIMQVERLVENPGYPWYLFSVGNMETLKEIPESKGVNVRDMLMKFYSDNYSANVMNLVILGRESLDQLTEWAVEKFSDIVNKNVTVPSFEDCPNKTNVLMTQTFIKPVKDIRNMTLNFPFPVQEELYDTKPSWYICHLIHREGPGSLMTFLKNKGWVSYLSASISTGYFGLDAFEICIGLTEDGIGNYEDIIVYVFEYIEMLKKGGVQQWIFDELKSLYETSFRFMSKDSSMDYSIFLSKQLQKKIPLDYIISDASLLKKYDPEIIERHINELRTDNFSMVMVAQEFPNGLEPTMKEKWFSVDYTTTRISNKLEERLKTISSNPEFALPSANEYIPNPLNVIKEDIKEKTKKPDLVKETPILRIWHKKDDTFWTPKTYICMRIKSPLVYATPRNFILSMIYNSLLYDTLAGDIYDANVAGLSNYVSFYDRGIMLSFKGYSDKVPHLMEKVVGIIKNFEVNEDRFKVIKSDISRSFNNFFLESPSYHTEYYLNLALFQREWSIEDILKEIKDIEAAEVQVFYPTLLRSLHIEALVVGNVDKDRSISLIEKVESILSPIPLMPSQFIEGRGTKLPTGKHYIYQRPIQNADEVNSAIAYYIQIGYNSNNYLKTVAHLFSRICSEPCFNQLRTREQLGYSVSSFCTSRNGNLGFEIKITSKRDPIYLENRILEYLKSLRVIIEEMEDSEYESHVNSAISDKSEKFQTLHEEFDDYWTSIDLDYYEFDYAETDIKHLKLITKKKLLEFYDEFISPASATTSSLSVHLKSQVVPTDDQSDSTFTTGFIYPVLIHTKVCDKATLKESDLKNAIEEYEKEHGAITESDARNFLKKCQEKELIKAISDQQFDDIIDKLKKGFSSLSDYDHSKLPDDYILIDDIIKFKKQMPVSAAPTPRYTFQYP